MKIINLALAAISMSQISMPAPLPISELPGQRIKAAPRQFSEAADIVLEDTGLIDECEAEKICVEGQLYNQGRRPAYHVRLRVEIGGSKYGRPRTSFYRPVGETTMQPGDRQDVLVTLDRKVAYKEKGQLKEVEVGRYNFKIVPTWDDSLNQKKLINRPRKPASRRK